MQHATLQLSSPQFYLHFSCAVVLSTALRNVGNVENPIYCLSPFHPTHTKVMKVMTRVRKLPCFADLGNLPKRRILCPKEMFANVLPLTYTFTYFDCPDRPGLHIDNSWLWSKILPNDSELIHWEVFFFQKILWCLSDLQHFTVPKHFSVHRDSKMFAKIGDLMSIIISSEKKLTFKILQRNLVLTDLPILLKNFKVSVEITMYSF